MLNRDRSLWAATILPVAVAAAAAGIMAVAILVLLQTASQAEGPAYLEFAFRWAWLLAVIVSASWVGGVIFTLLVDRRHGGRSINTFTLGACVGPTLLVMAAALLGDSDAAVLWGVLLCLVVFALVLQLMLRRRSGVYGSQPAMAENPVETD